MTSLILATNNAGKIAELQAMLTPIVCIPQSQWHIPAVEETGYSFVENALLKARQACRFTGLAALADDSGLVVPALNGKPGIYSARFAGEHATDEENRQHLLDVLQTTPPIHRHAFFYCAIVLLRHEHDPTPLISTGRLDGLIHDRAVGTHGFGYDAVFYLPTHQCTLAELPSELKNTLSHRAQALSQLRACLHSHPNA